MPGSGESFNVEINHKPGLETMREGWEEYADEEYMEELEREALNRSLRQASRDAASERQARTKKGLNAYSRWSDWDKLLDSFENPQPSEWMAKSEQLDALNFDEIPEDDLWLVEADERDLLRLDALCDFAHQQSIRLDYSSLQLFWSEPILLESVHQELRSTRPGTRTERDYPFLNPESDYAIAERYVTETAAFVPIESRIEIFIYGIGLAVLREIKRINKPLGVRLDPYNPKFHSSSTFDSELESISRLVNHLQGHIWGSPSSWSVGEHDPSRTKAIDTYLKGLARQYPAVAFVIGSVLSKRFYETPTWLPQGIRSV